MNYLHPFDVTPAPRGYFVDLRTGAIHKLRTDYGAREFVTANRYVIDNPVDLIDAAKTPDTTIILNKPDYPIAKRLVTARNVAIVAHPAHEGMPTIRTADNWSGGDVMVEPTGALRFDTVAIDANFKTVTGINVSDQSDITVWRCLLRRFKNVCFRITGESSRITAAYSEFTDTKNNHGIGARETVDSILIMSCLAHGLGTTGSDDGFSWDLHGLGYEVAGAIGIDNHRGCKLPDSGEDGHVHHGYQDDGKSHRYAPIAIWKSNASYGRRPNNIYLDNLTLASSGYHVQISNADDIYIDTETIESVNSAGEPVELQIKGTIREYDAPESPPIIPDIPPIDPPDTPPTEPTAAALLAEIKVATALIALNVEKLEGMEINPASFGVGKIEGAGAQDAGRPFVRGLYAK